MGLEELVKISRLYGKDPRFILAAGGNTSYKDEKYIYVKASGFSMATIGVEGFVKLERASLDKIWERQYPDDPDLREKQALKDLMDSRVDGETKRPSVESLLHALLPQKYIVHTHPAMINGLTCSKEGYRISKEMFGSRCMWVPAVNPGYILAKSVNIALSEHKKKHNLMPDIILLENHGVFVGAQTTEDIKKIYDYIAGNLEKYIVRVPDFSRVRVSEGMVEKVRSRIKSFLPFEDVHITFENNNEISSIVRDRDSFKKVHSSYTPDHVLYAGPEMLFVEDQDSIENDMDDYIKRNNCYPKIIAVKMTGVFAAGEKENISRLAMVFFLNALKISIYAESFGGYKFMDKSQIDFIMNWEVEKFRSKVSLGK